MSGDSTTSNLPMGGWGGAVAITEMVEVARTEFPVHPPPMNNIKTKIYISRPGVGQITNPWRNHLTLSETSNYYLF